LLWSGLRLVAGLVQIAVMRLNLSPQERGWMSGAAAMVTIALFAWVLWRLVSGHWRPGLLSRFPALRHPAMLAVVVAGVFLVERAAAVIQTMLMVRQLSSMGMSYVISTAHYLGAGITFVTL